MNKKIIGKVVAAVLVAGMVPAIASCGGDIASQGNGEPQISEQSFEEGSGQIYDSTVSDIIASDDATPQDDQGITADEPSNDILEVIVKDDKHADFVFYGYGGESISDITVLDISYDRYTASFNSFMNNDCNVWNDEDNGKMTLCEGGKAGYTIENEKITITVDMSGVSGFSFDNVSGNGGPNMTLTWEDVANMDNYVSASQVAQSDTNNTSDISLQEIAESYWFIGKTLSSQGGNWGASNITLSGADSNGFPTKITVSGSGYSLDGELLDGSFSIKIEECNDEFLMGQFSGSSHASIKGEFYDSAGNCLVVDIY